MNAISIALVVVAFALILAGQWGVIEALLPGGRWNPYRAATVEKDHRRLRIVANGIVVVAALLLFSAAALIELGWHVG